MGNACIRAYGDSLIKVILAGKVTRVSHKPCKYNFLLPGMYSAFYVSWALVWTDGVGVCTSVFMYLSIGVIKYEQVYLTITSQLLTDSPFQQSSMNYCRYNHSQLKFT
jgi:hypothetical protein